jgi:hypothetical protein
MSHPLTLRHPDHLHESKESGTLMVVPREYVSARPEAVFTFAPQREPISLRDQTLQTQDKIIDMLKRFKLKEFYIRDVDGNFISDIKHGDEIMREIIMNLSMGNDKGKIFDLLTQLLPNSALYVNLIKLFGYSKSSLEDLLKAKAIFEDKPIPGQSSDEAEAGLLNKYSETANIISFLIDDISSQYDNTLGVRLNYFKKRHKKYMDSLRELVIPATEFWYIYLLFRLQLNLQRQEKHVKERIIEIFENILMKFSYEPICMKEISRYRKVIGYPLNESKALMRRVKGTHKDLKTGEFDPTIFTTGKSRTNSRGGTVKRQRSKRNLRKKHTKRLTPQ